MACTQCVSNRGKETKRNIKEEVETKQTVREELLPTEPRAVLRYSGRMAVNEFDCVGNKVVIPVLKYYCLNSLEKMRTMTKNFRVYRRTSDPDPKPSAVGNSSPNSQHCDVRWLTVKQT